MDAGCNHHAEHRDRPGIYAAVMWAGQMMCTSQINLARPSWGFIKVATKEAKYTPARFGKTSLTRNSEKKKKNLIRMLKLQNLYYLQTQYSRGWCKNIFMTYWISFGSFCLKSSKHLYSQIVWAESWENIHLPPCVTCYTKKNIKCIMSHVMCRKQSWETSWCMACYQWSLPCLVFKIKFLIVYRPTVCVINDAISPLASLQKLI